MVIYKLCFSLVFDPEAEYHESYKEIHEKYKQMVCN